MRLRGQLFSEDGREMVEQRIVFDCGDRAPPEQLAKAIYDVSLNPKVAGFLSDEVRLRLAANTTNTRDRPHDIK